MFYFADDKQVTVYFSNGGISTWNSTDKMYKKVLELCKDAKWVEIQTVSNPDKAIMTGTFTFDGDKMIVNGVSLDLESTALANMVKLLKEKGVIIDDVEPVRKFLLNAIQNPFINAVEEIYEYCKAMDFEITEDGCFLAYKKVRDDLGSIWDNGLTKHKIGEYTEVKLYDTDRNNVCSKGLHFCSKGYLKHYGSDEGTKVIIVKVNPIDVVSIPTDYNFQKGRCRKYMTVEVLEDRKQTLKEVVNDLNVKVVPKVNPKENYIERTVRLMKKYNNNEEKVATIMNVKVKTVKRNMQKYRAIKKAMVSSKVQ